MPDLSTRCKATTKRGTPCRAAATETGYCFFHSHPEKAAEIGRSGGRNNRHVVDDDPRPLPPLTDVASLRQAVAQMIDDVHSKRLDPKKAAGMAPLFNVLLRSIQTQELEDRIKTLETQLQQACLEQIAKADAETDGPSPLGVK